MKKHFFNKILSFFKSHKIQNKKIILGISGGLDSVVLLDLLSQLRRPCRLQLYIAHIHHGPSHKKLIQTYRKRACEQVYRLSQNYSQEFLCSPQAQTILKSEEGMRNFRHFHFKKFLRQKRADILALAHNKNDLLETQLIQLIRGCGKTGLKALPAHQAPYLRPLLFWTRQEIECYARENQLQWIEDPSNKDNRYLRNWIRNQWLLDLEKKRPGSQKSLARSLDLLSHSEKEDSLFLAVTNQGIRRKFLMELPLKDQKRLLAFYMRKLKLSHYGQSHIEEILKHLERKEKRFSIKLLKKTWSFTTQFISAK